MKIVLKNIRASGKLKWQPAYFRALLYINGYKVGRIDNNGRGGPFLHHPRDDQGRLLIQEAEAWCRTLPAVAFPDTLINGKPLTMRMDLEIYLDRIITAWLNKRNYRQYLREMKDAMFDGIVFGIPASSFRVLKFSGPIADLVGCNDGRERLKEDILTVIIPLLGEGGKILNTNIPIDVIKEIGIDDALWVMRTAG